MSAPAVVIGVGNPFRGDDGAGIEVARLVAAYSPPGVDVVEHDGEPAGLLEAWSGRRRAYVVDAVRSGAPVGTVHVVEVGSGPIPAAPRPGGRHALGAGEAVELARVLDRLPGRLVLVGIEGGRFAQGEPMSVPVREAVRSVARWVAAGATRGAA